jgi:alpha-tubulin suppressor-like RCC1 family protein
MRLLRRALLNAGVLAALGVSQPGHAWAATGAGGAWSWGDDTFGELGNGSNVSSDTPQPVTLPAGVMLESISGGYLHNLGIDTRGTAWAWGDNAYGQLGDGSTVDSNVPTQAVMPLGTTFVRVSAGGYHSLALDSSGAAWAWGSNSQGELGNGGTGQLGPGGQFIEQSPTAVVMPPRTSFTAVSAGFQTSVALDSGGDAWAWGSDTEGELGNGTTTDNTPNAVPVPVSMPAGVTFTAVSSGGQFDVALDTAGRAWAWGYDYNGELGNGSPNQSGNPSTANGCFCSATPVPVQMPQGVAFAAISAGNYFTVALDTTGRAWAWGDDFYGQLGDGKYGTDASVCGQQSGDLCSAVPVLVSMPAGVTLTSARSGGFGYVTVALDRSGAAWAWGDNYFGESGTGTTTQTGCSCVDAPVQVHLPIGVTFEAASGGGRTALALSAAPGAQIPEAPLAPALLLTGAGVALVGVRTSATRAGARRQLSAPPR